MGSARKIGFLWERVAIYVIYRTWLVLLCLWKGGVKRKKVELCTCTVFCHVQLHGVICTMAVSDLRVIYIGWRVTAVLLFICKCRYSGYMGYVGS